MRAPRVPAVVLVLVACACVVGGPASAQGGGLAYTVQVAALSDPESAIDQSGTLLRAGFPAYVVRAEGQAGTVFRVRVGAFGDRASADRYARLMGERAGGTPRPALAEAIPAGILPLAPTAVARVEPDRRAVLLPWGEGGVVLRVGPVGALAHYDPLDGGTGFDALWAAPRGEGREEIATVSLDGEAAGDDAADVREALFRQRLRLVAERSGVPEEELARAVRGEPGSRHLIAWREVNGADAIHGVLAPGADPTERDADAWLGETPPEPAAPLLVLSDPARPDATEGAADAAEDGDEAGAAGDDDDNAAVDEGAPDDGDADMAAGEGGDAVAAGDGAAEGEAAAAHEDDGDASMAIDDAGDAADAGGAAAVSGDGWTARADGAWAVLQVDDVTWRALVGAPRAGVMDLLVLDVEGALEVVRLVPR